MLLRCSCSNFLQVVNPKPKGYQNSENGDHPDPHPGLAGRGHSLMVAAQFHHSCKHNRFQKTARPTWSLSNLYIWSMRSIVILVAILGPALGWAQLGAPLATDPASQGMGGLLSPESEQYQVHGNPAVLASSPSFGIHAFSVLPYSISSLSTAYVQAWLPSRGSGWGIGMSYSGLENWRNTTVHLGYGQRLWSRLDLGVGLDAFFVDLSDYGQVQAWSAKIGAHLRILDDLIAGVLIQHPYTLTDTEAYGLPHTVRTSLAYRLSDQVSLAGEWLQAESQPADLRVGFTYRPIDDLPIRFGYQSLNNAFTVGLGYRWREAWQVDASAGYHPFLGFSPALGICWQPSSPRS